MTNTAFDQKIYPTVIRLFTCRNVRDMSIGQLKAARGWNLWSGFIAILVKST